MLNEAQEIAHYKGIGGSMAAAILGLDKFRTNVEAYLLLTNEEFRAKQRAEIENKLVVKLGHALENIVADQIAIEKNWKLTTPDTFIDPEYDFLMGNVDRAIEGTNEFLEIKVRGNFGVKDYGEEGTDEVKDSDLIQMMHYMMVGKYDAGNLGLLSLGTSEIKYFRVERNEGLIAEMRAQEVEFWRNHIEPRIPPAPKTYYEASKLWPLSQAKPVCATQDIVYAVNELKRLKQIVKDTESLIDVEQVRIASFMEENDTLITEMGSKLLTYKTQPNNRLDVDLLKAKYPHIYQECMPTGRTTRVMRLSK